MFRSMLVWLKCCCNSALGFSLPKRRGSAFCKSCHREAVPQESLQKSQVKRAAKLAGLG